MQINKFTLGNGLRVLHVEDNTTPMVVINTLYVVGSKYENPEHTGIAHLSEHLMFSGSRNVPNFDELLDNAGASNNAFTTIERTNYYTVVPRCNVEVAFWAESDRMFALNLSDESIETQRSVVIEEFKQRYLNSPYGDSTLLLLREHYKGHYYEWTPIGKSIKQLEEVSREIVRDFWRTYYSPGNAILVVAGNITLEETQEYVHKYYDDIESVEVPKFVERQCSNRHGGEKRFSVKRDVPQDAVYMAFHSPHEGRDFFASDLISDMLSTGNSSRFFTNLLRGTNKFAQTNAYIEGYHDSDSFVVTAIPNVGEKHNEVENLLWNELEKLKTDKITQYEIEKTVNRIELYRTHESTSLTEVAQNIAKFESEGRLDMYEHEIEQYRAVTPEDISRVASEMFVRDNCTTLWFEAK